MLTSVGVHVRPQLAEAVPGVYVTSDAVKVVVFFAVTQLVPAFHESCTQSFGTVPVPLFSASRRTSMPLITELAGIERP